MAVLVLEKVVLFDGKECKILPSIDKFDEVNDTLPRCSNEVVFIKLLIIINEFWWINPLAPLTNHGCSFGCPPRCLYKR